MVKRYDVFLRDPSTVCDVALSPAQADYAVTLRAPPVMDLTLSAEQHVFDFTLRPSITVCDIVTNAVPRRVLTYVSNSFALDGEVRTVLRKVVYLVDENGVILMDEEGQKFMEGFEEG